MNVMRSDLLDNAERTTTPGTFQLQNARMLKVDLAGTAGHFFARQGSMVAYQGEVDFAYEGSGGVGKFFKKALTGEGMSLMRVTGSGQVFLAQDADEIFLLAGSMSSTGSVRVARRARRRGRARRRRP